MIHVRNRREHSQVIQGHRGEIVLIEDSVAEEGREGSRMMKEVRYFYEYNPQLMSLV